MIQQSHKTKLSLIKPVKEVLAAAAESTASQPAYDNKYPSKLAPGFNVSCTPFPVYSNFYKKFETNIPAMVYDYEVCHVKVFVKWQVDDGPTHAQLLLRRLGKEQFSSKSKDPWKKPVQFPVATFGGDSPSNKEEKMEFNFTETNDLFWKPGKKGRYTFLQHCIPKCSQRYLL